MSATGSASSVVDLPLVADEKFLAKTAEILDRLRAESDLRGHRLLSALLAITKGEAEDTLRTNVLSVRPRNADFDDGVVEMAQKLAWRANASA